MHWRPFAPRMTVVKGRLIWNKFWPTVSEVYPHPLWIQIIRVIIRVCCVCDDQGTVRHAAKSRHSLQSCLHSLHLKGSWRGLSSSGDLTWRMGCSRIQAKIGCGHQDKNGGLKVDGLNSGGPLWPQLLAIWWATLNSCSGVGSVPSWVVELTYS